MDLSLGEPGVVHVWYYIPLWTIFPHQFNGEALGTSFSDFQSSPQAKNPLQRKVSAPQSYNPWWLPEDHFRTPTPWFSRCWVFHSNSIPQGNNGPGLFKGNFKRLSSFKSAFKESSTPALLGQLNCSIQMVFKKPVWNWPIWSNSYSTVGIQDTKFTSQDGSM
ncbi:hypothetical protein O181_114177 [Austropuccinia psidii MF-1]|uniref:Uncharacterized protein n=1 Tax=Austropuccinia psidii MF-1 TaxID=1389203 RepID=A0A9Q3PW37_9BASI|nr:hypothetical protein [Austropuccinia psidii MF-1]